MARKSKFDSVLGVFVSDTLVDAVLMARTEGRIHVLNRFGRPRSRLGDRVSDLTSVLPGLKDSTEADFTLEVGDGTPGADPSSLFLSSEFGTAVDVKAQATTSRQTAPITTQIKDILAECANMGHHSLHVSFCLGSSDVLYKEISPPRSEQKTGVLSILENNTTGRVKVQSAPEGLVRGMARRQLVDHLSAQGIGLFDRKRAAFIPMTPKAGRERYLAVVPRTPDSLTTTLKELNATHSQLSAVADIVDTEVSLYLTLAQQQAQSADIEKMAVIRVGTEDTILLLVHNGQLAEFERIRSLTSYDPTETVCSRVLLRQDETKFGDLDHVMVVSEDRRENAYDVLQGYFPTATVEWVQDALAQHRVQIPPGDEFHLKSTSLPAIGVGLRWMEEWDRQNIGVGLNLLPRKLTRRKKQGSKLEWHTYAMMMVIFGIAFFFSWKFMTNQQQINTLNRQIALDPPEFPDEDPAILKMRVDSLNAAFASYTSALGVLDSLLIGSDKWTRSIAGMTESTGSIGSIWLKAWTPITETRVRLQGNALSRSRIARLAQRWQGSIEKLNFADIQNVRVYSFVMTIPVPSEMPPVALHLRETALEQDIDRPIGTQ